MGNCNVSPSGIPRNKQNRLDIRRGTNCHKENRGIRASSGVGMPISRSLRHRHRTRCSALQRRSVSEDCPAPVMSGSYGKANARSCRFGTAVDNRQPASAAGPVEIVDQIGRSIGSRACLLEPSR